MKKQHYGIFLINKFGLLKSKPLFFDKQFKWFAIISAARTSLVFLELQNCVDKLVKQGKRGSKYLL